MFIQISSIILLLLSGASMAAMIHQKLGVSAEGITTQPAWNLSITTDGTNLPSGQGSIAQGQKIFAKKCSTCHGRAGIGASANTLVGELDSLKSKYPEKTVNSYWPYATTLFDYIRRAMPPDAPFSLTANEVYALSAYILSVDTIIPVDLVMNKATLPKVKMPNRDGFRQIFNPIK